MNRCEKVVAQSRALQTERGSLFSASMLRDIEKGGLIEGEHIIGDMIARAKQLGVATPNLRLALLPRPGLRTPPRPREGRFLTA